MIKSITTNRLNPIKGKVSFDKLPIGASIVKDALTHVDGRFINTFETHKHEDPRMLYLLAAYLEDSTNSPKVPNKAYENFVKIKDEMLSQTQDLNDKQTIKHWLRSNNIELFNWMLNDENGKEALKYIQKYGRIGVYKAEKLFADSNVPKEEIAVKLKNSDPKKAEI